MTLVQVLQVSRKLQVSSVGAFGRDKEMGSDLTESLSSLSSRRSFIRVEISSSLSLMARVKSCTSSICEAGQSLRYMLYGVTRSPTFELVVGRCRARQSRAEIPQLFLCGRQLVLQLEACISAPYTKTSREDNPRLTSVRAVWFSLSFCLISRSSLFFSVVSSFRLFSRSSIFPCIVSLSLLPSPSHQSTESAIRQKKLRLTLARSTCPLARGSYCSALDSRLRAVRPWP